MANKYIDVAGKHIVQRRRFYIMVACLCLILGGLLIAKAGTNPSRNTVHTEESLESSQPAEVVYEFPGGGRTLLPTYRFVALYGSPNAPMLGVLGEQSATEAVQRIKKQADEYANISDKPVYPTMELIATIAAREPTDNHDYSRELSLEKLQPWVDAASEAGVYVVLDLQPGRTDFLTQAKLYESLLRQPHVGLALDPEWRLKPNQTHLRQIGQVSYDEVQATANWLADLTKRHDLPQKLFVLHQFKHSMLPGRDKLDTTRQELAWVLHVDGQGTQPQKQDTWRSLTAELPSGMFTGWKNFIDEDHPMLTAEQTMQVAPLPDLITYQ